MIMIQLAEMSFREKLKNVNREIKISSRLKIEFLCFVVQCLYSVYNAFNFQGFSCLVQSDHIVP